MCQIHIINFSSSDIRKTIDCFELIIQYWLYSSETLITLLIPSCYVVNYVFLDKSNQDWEGLVPLSISPTLRKEINLDSDRGLRRSGLQSMQQIDESINARSRSRVTNTLTSWGFGYALEIFIEIVDIHSSICESNCRNPFPEWAPVRELREAVRKKWYFACAEAINLYTGKGNPGSISQT